MFVPFPQEVRQAVEAYVTSDLDGGLDDHVERFGFLSCDPALKQRVGEEYFAARFLYKFWEGMRINDDTWAVRAQVQLQVQQYASIYEACLHHLLFAHAGDEAVVKDLLRLKTLAPYSVPAHLRTQLASFDTGTGRDAVAAVERTITLDSAKVRFDKKVEAAVDIGIVAKQLGDELIDFYAARNMIHIHAELRKGSDWAWTVGFARNAYRRLQPFSEQAANWLASQTAGAGSCHSA